jgi:hypothetical protein
MNKLIGLCFLLAVALLTLLVAGFITYVAPSVVATGLALAAMVGGFLLTREIMVATNEYIQPRFDGSFTKTASVFAFQPLDDDDDDFLNPTVNIDGSPMCGGVDVNGNPYGVTSSSYLSNDDSYNNKSHFYDDDSYGTRNDN